MRLQPETRWLQPLTKLWVDAETGSIAVTSPNADALQVATLQHRLSGFLRDPAVAYFRFEESKPWDTWGRMAGAFAMTLLLPYGWHLGHAFDGLRELRNRGV